MEKARAPRFPRSAARAGLLVSLLALLVAASLGAQTQTPLPGSSIPQFVDALPSLNILVAGAAQIELDMKEFQAEVLSTGTLVPGVAPKTWVWGYTTPGQLVFPSYIGPVIVATRGTPTEIKCVNNLGTTATSNLLAYTHSVDQTLHWADPLGGEANTGSMNVIPGQLPLSPWNQNFAGTTPRCRTCTAERFRPCSTADRTPGSRATGPIMATTSTPGTGAAATTRSTAIPTPGRRRRSGSTTTPSARRD